MEALMRVMTAKKQEISAVQAEKTKMLIQNKEGNKYLRRAEVEKLLERDQVEVIQKTKTKHQDEQKKQKLDHKTPTHSEYTETKTNDNTLPEALLAWPDLRRRLRELGEPITLFGESLLDRMTRLRRVEMDVATKHDDELGAGHDIRNRFIGGEEGDHKEEADDAAEDAEEFEASVETRRKSKRRTRDDLEREEEEEEKDTDKMVYRFFKGMLQRWENDLANRPDHVKRTAQGKIAVKTMKQCKDYIRPLFKLCKKRQVPSDILPKLVDIVKFCRQGEFVMANDAYIKLAIGNAAWPIGVTMVGIHERTGREKINSNKQAHVMNNESQRKYLTSVKRLMSYAQSVSNVPPSKRVL
uniref:Pre-mRNA-splicing factor 18 n=1 Tax=Peronospora matthiolae TaxID=2874970 RepID=A0AAV1UBC3_9STRA